MFQVKVFVEETLKKGVKGLVAEFKAMKRLNDLTKMTEFLAQTPQGRNRYKVSYRNKREDKFTVEHAFKD